MKSPQSRHATMVNDPKRTPVLEQAIAKLIKPGDVVFDLGCGLGVLTFAALKAGARKVYACDIDDAALKTAMKEAKKKGVSDQIEFFNDLSSNVDLPEKVDVILAETVGSLGLDENIVPFVIDARNRLLKEDGKILPNNMTVWVAPCGSKQIPSPRVGEGGRRPGEGGSWTAEIIKPEQLLAKPQKYVSIDFYKVRKPFFDKEVVFNITNDSSLSGFAVWFEVEWIPSPVGERGSTHPSFTTRTSPSDAPTHWKQGVLWNGNGLKLKKDQKLLFRLIMGPKEDFFDTQSLTEWGFKIMKS